MRDGKNRVRKKKSYKYILNPNAKEMNHQLN